MYNSNPFKGFFLIIDGKKVSATKEILMQLSNKELLGIYILLCKKYLASKVM